jgi:predicted metal-dependent peptidase
MTKARAQLVLDAPFFGVLALNLELEEGNWQPTMAVDGKTIVYNTEFVASLSDDEIKAVLAHVVMHLALKHHLRRGSRDPELWNVAGDHVINLELLASFNPKFVLPEPHLADPQYKGLTTDDVYRLLEQEQQQADTDPGDGKSSAGKPSKPKAGDPGRCGSVIDAASDPGELADQEIEWDIAVNQAISVAQRAGTLPGAAQVIIDSIKKPKADWRSLLRRFIDPSSRRDYSWARPNRRFSTAPYVLPGMATDGVNHIGVVIDDSGSISVDLLRKFFGELQGAMDEGGVDKFTIIHCNTTIGLPSEYVGGDQLIIKPARGGGTCFAPPFRWFEENEPDVSGLVYFTDMDNSDKGLLAANPSTIPTLWASYGDPRLVRSQAVPFGEVIELD